MELIKENIEYEQLMEENSVDSILRDEYVIPDTLPDVQEVLMLDCVPRIEGIQMLDNKILIDCTCQHTVLYINKNEEGTDIHCTDYSTRFTNSVDYKKDQNQMYCDAECFVEHMECNIVNERKVCIEGIVSIKAQVFSKNEYEIVKDVDNDYDIHFYKTPMVIDKIVENMHIDLSNDVKMKVSMNKPPIKKIVKFDCNLHKKDVRILDGKVNVELWSKVVLLYKALENDREIFVLEDDILVEKEIPMENIRESMTEMSNFQVSDMTFNVEDDDLGEKRIVNCSLMVRGNMKIMNKDEIQAIEDAYSTTMPLELNREKHMINMIQDKVTIDTIVRGDIEIDKNMPMPKEIIYCKATLNLSDKEISDDKVTVEGVVIVKIMYKTNSEEMMIYSVEDEIPFVAELEEAGAKPNMKVMASAYLENIDCEIEGNSIAIKAVVKTTIMVSNTITKELLVDLNQTEGPSPIKKASMIIYMVQKDDSLWKVAKKYNTTIEKLLQLNDIENPENLQIGTKLIIQGRAII